MKIQNALKKYKILERTEGDLERSRDSSPHTSGEEICIRVGLEWFWEVVIHGRVNLEKIPL